MPLTILLKKGTQVFDALVKIVINELVLWLSNFSVPFKVHTNAFVLVFDNVLMQEGNLIIFESQKLGDV